MLSVVVATFNGSKYIQIQLNSILSQLKPFDEVIVIDDCSVDDTVIKIDQLDDPRIKLFKNNVNIGHVKSFEKGILACSGDIIFLSDQDDYWLPNKTEVMVNELNSNNFDLIISSYFVSQNQGVVDKLSAQQVELRASHRINNLVSIISGNNQYLGSLMCFKKSAIQKYLPFPDFIEAHDIYIASAFNIDSKVGHINIPLVIRTLTGHNLTTSNRSLFKKFLSRFIFFRTLLFRFLSI
ncbi:MAG: alpha-L-Rha alpha-1 3-L-rhamnosyltransferase [Chitinophagaceae bacterium]|nr:MAG: alpha-L-Rha alpha-1 3-L-rhamnosyltransferase [Chitinophagaceae bacterium]